MSRIWSEALIGQHSSYIVLALVHNDRQKTNGHKGQINVNTMNLHYKTVNIRGKYSS